MVKKTEKPEGATPIQRNKKKKKAEKGYVPVDSKGNIITEANLKAEITRILTADNAQEPQAIVSFSNKTRGFVIEQRADHNVALYELEGYLLHRESEEGIRQLSGKRAIEEEEVPEAKDDELGEDLEEEGEDEEKDTDSDASGDKERERGGEEQSVENLVTDGGAPGEEEQEEEGDEEGDADFEGEGEEGATKKKSKLVNKFNCAERATQTYLIYTRDHTGQTEPPPLATYGQQVFQWSIFDDYGVDHAKRTAEKEKQAALEKAMAREAAGLPPVRVKAKEGEGKKRPMFENPLMQRDLSVLFHPTKILERMVNQNSNDDIALDYKYWEDLADEYRNGRGTLLPLWRFHYEKLFRKFKMYITSMKWSPVYDDMFAVGYGSYDFHKQPIKGLICIFTLKNHKYPEYVRELPCGVMCIDYHHTCPYLLAMGLYNGSVIVIDLRGPELRPLIKSSLCLGKHSSVVYEVKWAADNSDGDKMFYSISADGIIYGWSVMQTDLKCMEIARLLMDNSPVKGPDDTIEDVFASGTTFAFHRVEPTIYIIGTEEGCIRLYSTDYASEVIQRFQGHYLVVHSVQWNYFHPDIFISCSADWTCKIWKRDRSDPVFVYHLGAAVSDAVWAHHSSTMFAVATFDGKILIYDLAINTTEPVCSQFVVPGKRATITRLAFNPKEPVLLIGDDRGVIVSVKLSPNLRKPPKDAKGNPLPDDLLMEFQLNKIEKVLTLTHDPSLPPGQDPASVQK